MKIESTPRILSLDGGGVRGLSSLVILRDIMDEIGYQANVENPRPCDYFDLICGTSTGGLIAIMLGQLGMVSSPEELALMLDGAGMHRYVFTAI